MDGSPLLRFIYRGISTTKDSRMAKSSKKKVKSIKKAIKKGKSKLAGLKKKLKKAKK